MTFTKADLIKKGYEALQEAHRLTNALEYREAEIQIRIADSYSRLADSLGDKRISITTRPVHNW